MAQEIILDLTVDASGGQRSIAEIKQAVKEAKQELSNMADTSSLAFKQLALATADASVKVREFNKELKGISPEQLVRGFAGFGKAVTGAFAVGQGAIGLFGKETKAVAEAQKHALETLNVVLGVNAVAEGVVKAAKAASFLQSKALTVAIQLEKAAQSENVIVQYASAAAMRVLNAVMAANPFALVVIAVTALAGALLFFVNRTDEAKEAQERLNKQLAEEKRLSEINYNAFKDVQGKKLDALDNEIKVEESKMGLLDKGTKAYIAQEDLIIKKKKERLEYIVASVDADLKGGWAIGKQVDELTKQAIDAKAELLVLSNEQSAKEKENAKEAKKLADEVSKKKIEAAKAVDEFNKKADETNLKLDQDDIKNQFANQRTIVANAIGTAQEKADKIKAIDIEEKTALLKLETDYGKATAEIQNQIAINTIEQQKKKEEEITKAFEDGIAAIEAKAKAAEQLSNSPEELNAIQQNKIKSELSFLNTQVNLTGEAAKKKLNIETVLQAQLKKLKQEEVKIELEKDAAVLDSFSQLAGATSGLAQQGSAEAKALALFQIELATASAIAKGVAAAQDVPFPGNLIAIVTTIATVLSNISQARAIFDSASQPSGFATGGMVYGEGTGTSDSIPARLSHGESVINAKSTSMFAPLLSRINQAGGGRPFALGGIADATSSINNVMMQTGNIEALLAKQVELLSSPQRNYVVESDITTAQKNVATIQSRARY